MPKQKDSQSDTPKKRQSHLRCIARFAANNTPLPEIMFISTFILIRWWNNSDFSYPSEMVIPILFFAVLVSVIFYIYRLILGPGLATHIASLFLAYLFYVFQFVENNRGGQIIYDLLPASLSSPFARSLILAFLLGSICGLLAWLVAKFLDNFKITRQLQPYKVLLFVLVFIFVVQLFRTGVRLFDLRHQLSYKYPAPALQLPLNHGATTKPDIYYLVFDRYASPEVLKANFGSNNSEIVDYLAEQGFVTRQNAYSNYAFTMSSIASTMAMNYFPEFEKQFGSDGRWQSAAPYRSILNNPPIAQILHSNGYNYNQVSSWWEL